jgi:hypothetical protein
MENFWITQSFEFFEDMQKKGGDVGVDEYDRNFEAMKEFLNQRNFIRCQLADRVLDKVKEKTGIHGFDRNSLDVEAFKIKLKEKEEEVERIKIGKDDEFKQLNLILDQEKEKLAQRNRKIQEIQTEINGFDEKSRKCVKVIESYLKFISALGVFVGKNGNKVEFRVNRNSMELQHIDGFRFKPKFEGNWMIYQNIDYIFGSELFSNFIRLLESDESN